MGGFTYEENDEYLEMLRYEKAAKQGNVEAQYRMGCICYRMRHVYSDNLAYAYYWLKEAERSGHGNAKQMLYQVKAADLSMAALYDVWDLWCLSVDAEMEDRAFDAFMYCSLAAEQGCVTAQYQLADFYYEGYGCDRDEKKMLLWYQKAAGEGHASAMVALANCCRDAIGVPQDDKMCFYWSEQAALTGSAWGKNALGNCYMWGIGTSVNKTLGIKYWREAADMGETEAIFNIGCAYLWGEGVTLDGMKGREYLRKADARDYIPAKLVLLDQSGTCYYLCREIGPVAGFLAADEWVQRDKGMVYIEAVGPSDDSMTFKDKYVNHLKVYAWLWDVDDEGDARLYESMLGWNKDYQYHNLKLVRYKYPYESFSTVDQYRLQHDEYNYIGSEIPMGQCDYFMNQLARAMEIYLGEDYKTTVKNQQILVQYGK